MEHTLLLALLLVSPAVQLHNSAVTNVTEPNSTINSSVTFSDSQLKPCNHTTAPVTVNPRAEPVVHRVKVKWDKTSPCQGKMQLSINFTDTKPICFRSTSQWKSLGGELCEERRCGAFKNYSEGSREMGFSIYDNLTLVNDSCMTMLIKCEDNNELVAYKVVTGLLLALILIVVLIRFVWPRYIDVRKRYSQKRQNRWIGPTQSQSVSYHRGQAGLMNDTVKRHSYPGLERLSVNPSREPSSNRNSDYDSYGYN